tara:strand:+ start:36478 stop:37065 length:588 start_codon:yes stop_codon:yes gene_type:complete
VKEKILSLFKRFNISEGRLLEINTFETNIAEYIAEEFPALHWICSSEKKNHTAIKNCLIKAKLPNIHGPETFMLGKDDFPGKRPFDYVFIEETLSYLSWKENKALFKLLGKRLRESSLVILHETVAFGEGEMSSELKKEDRLLKEKNPQFGIRHFDNIVQAMDKNGFKLLEKENVADPSGGDTTLMVFERRAFKA